METKVVTIRLPQATYEKLCKLADESEELPSETARRILRESLTVTQENLGETVVIAEAIPDKIVAAEEIPYEDDN